MFILLFGLYKENNKGSDHSLLMFVLLLYFFDDPDIDVYFLSFYFSLIRYTQCNL